jgi:hypothetical protein
VAALADGGGGLWKGTIPTTSKVGGRLYLFLFHGDGTLKIEPTIILARLQLAKHRCKVFNKKMILQARSFRHICETKLRVIPAHRQSLAKKDEE